MFCVAKINNLGKNNNSQHCWMLHVASVCTPCFMLLHVVASCCIRLHTTANTDATSHLLGLNNSSIRIKLKSFEKVASSLFTIRSLDSPHWCYQDFYTWVASPTGSPSLYLPPWNPNVTTVRCSLSTCSVKPIDDVIMMTQPFRLCRGQKSQRSSDKLGRTMVLKFIYFDSFSFSLNFNFITIVVYNIDHQRKLKYTYRVHSK